MASSRIATRLSSRLNPFAKKSVLSELSSPTLIARSDSKRISRLPLQLSVVLDSMMPLHSAVASSRLVSSLSIESHHWGLVPQGISMPL